MTEDEIFNLKLRVQQLTEENRMLKKQHGLLFNKEWFSVPNFTTENHILFFEDGVQCCELRPGDILFVIRKVQE